MSWCAPLLALCACFEATSGARVLGVFYMSSYSHFVLGETLLKELAARGHQVTMVSPFPQKAPVDNYTDVALPEILEIMQRRREEKSLFDVDSIPKILLPIIVGKFCTQLTEATFQSEGVRNLLSSNETFDVVIMEQFHNDAHQGFAHHFKAPSIVFSTIGSSPWTNRLVGNPAPPSYASGVFLGYSSKMSFLQRVVNTLYYIVEELYVHFCFFPGQDEILRRHFPGAPHIYDLVHNTSLVLLNSHASFRPALPHVPNMVEIGGFHVGAARGMPDELRSFLDEADEGVVFFSLGSNLQSKDLPSEKRDGILRALAKLRMKVVWKWEEERLPGQPENVILGKWWPQRDVLAHPNVKVFITHGGLLSIIEAIRFGIPLIGIPIFGDQRMNMADAEEGGYGITVPYKDLNEDTLDAALKEITENPKYARVAKERSRILADQPRDQLDLAVYWIEYIVRHKGGPHLRSAAVDLAWYQYVLLDVVAFLLAIALGTIFVVYFAIRKCLKVKRRKHKAKVN